MEQSAMSLSSYEPVSLAFSGRQVRDEDIEMQIQQLLTSLPEYKATKEPAKIGDKVTAIISLVEAGEPMKGWDQLELPFRLGDGFVFDGLSEGIVGMHPGEVKDFEFEVPAIGGSSDSEEPETNTVEAHVELLEVNGAQKASMTDEWVAKNGGRANTVAELREQIAGQLQGQFDREFTEQAREYCSAVLGSRLVGKVPDEDVARSRKGVVSQFENMLVQRQLTEEQYLQQEGIDREGLEQRFDMEAQQTAAIGHALELMADYLEITVSQDDLEDVFQQAGSKVSGKDALSSYLAGGGDRADVERIARCKKALDAVVAQAEMQVARV